MSHIVCLQELRRAQGHVRGRCRPGQAQDARERVAGDQGDKVLIFWNFCWPSEHTENILKLNTVCNKNICILQLLFNDDYRPSSARGWKTTMLEGIYRYFQSQPTYVYTWAILYGMYGKWSLIAPSLPQVPGWHRCRWGDLNASTWEWIYIFDFVRPPKRGIWRR